MSNDNLTVIKFDPDKWLALIAKAKSQMKYQAEFSELQAKVARIDYDAYIKEGFTPMQAIALCKK